MSFDQFTGADRHRHQAPDGINDRLNSLAIFEPPPLVSIRDSARSDSTNNVNESRERNLTFASNAATFLPDAGLLLDGLKDNAQGDARVNQPVSSRVHQLIGGAGDTVSLSSRSEIPGRSFRNWDNARTELTRIGISALPQLMLAISAPGSELNLRRLAEGTRDGIMNDISDMQLLDLRDQRLRDQLIDTGLGRRPTPEEAPVLNAALDEQISLAIGRRLVNPEWLSVTQMFSNFRVPALRPPTEEAVRQFDHIATEEGHRQISSRLSQLNAMFLSRHLTNSERETVYQRIRDVAELMSPAYVAESRVAARIELAQFRQSVAPDADRALIHSNVLEAFRIGDARARSSVSKAILEMGLDENEAFMQQFSRLAPARTILEMQERRARIRSNHELEAEQMRRRGGDK